MLFVADAEAAPVTELGPKLEVHPLFPNRINVEFAQVIDPGHIRMRVWERGVGVTLACGTGACATAVAAVRRGLAGAQGRGGARRRQIESNGGKNDGHMLMTGPAKTVFPGQIDLDAYGN